MPCISKVRHSASHGCAGGRRPARTEQAAGRVSVPNLPGNSPQPSPAHVRPQILLGLPPGSLCLRHPAKWCTLIPSGAATHLMAMQYVPEANPHHELCDVAVTYRSMACSLFVRSQLLEKTFGFYICESSPEHQAGQSCCDKLLFACDQECRAGLHMPAGDAPRMQMVEQQTHLWHNSSLAAGQSSTLMHTCNAHFSMLGQEAPHMVAVVAR